MNFILLSLFLWTKRWCTHLIWMVMYLYVILCNQTQVLIITVYKQQCLH